jgi:elongation factor 3
MVHKYNLTKKTYGTLMFTLNLDEFQGAFSLAYGTLTLLRDAKMHLKRNRFYGLLGPNQCGKTTLMRAIANEQLEGFPKRDELKSVFVDHEIEDEEVEGDHGKIMKNTDKNLGYIAMTDGKMWEA